jgi:hypothetical protein
VKQYHSNYVLCDVPAYLYTAYILSAVANARVGSNEQEFNKNIVGKIGGGMGIGVLWISKKK